MKNPNRKPPATTFGIAAQFIRDKASGAIDLGLGLTRKVRNLEATVGNLERACRDHETRARQYQENIRELAERVNAAGELRRSAKVFEADRRQAMAALEGLIDEGKKAAESGDWSGFVKATALARLSLKTLQSRKPLDGIGRTETKL